MLVFMQHGPLSARLTPVTVFGEKLREAKIRVFKLAIFLLETFPELIVTPTSDGRSLEIEATQPGDVVIAGNAAKNYLRTV